MALDQFPESVDPFDPSSANLFVRAEHLARYLYAAQFLRKRRLWHVLDAGCADGYGCRVMARCAEEVCGVERRAALVEAGRARCAGEGIGNVSLVQAALPEDLGPLGEGRFDLATCFEVLEHVPRDGVLLDGLRAALRRGGWLLLSVPKAGYEPMNGDRPRNPHHLRLYRRDALEVLLQEHGFLVERLLGQPYANISRLHLEDWLRDNASGQNVTRFFAESPQALEFYARMWGWPTDEAKDRAAGFFAVCRRG